MTTIPAIGMAGSLIRRFQEQPQLGVDLLKACEAVRDTCPADCDITPRWNAAWDSMLAAIAKARQEDRHE